MTRESYADVFRGTSPQLIAMLFGEFPETKSQHFPRVRSHPELNEYKIFSLINLLCEMKLELRTVGPLYLKIFNCVRHFILKLCKDLILKIL